MQPVISSICPRLLRLPPSPMFSCPQGTSTSAFDFLTSSFHRGEVTGMDVCIRKPIVATCSMDRSVRVWNYENK